MPQSNTHTPRTPWYHVRVILERLAVLTLVLITVSVVGLFMAPLGLMVPEIILHPIMYALAGFAAAVITYSIAVNRTPELTRSVWTVRIWTALATVASTVFSVMFFFFRPPDKLVDGISMLPGGRFAVVLLAMALIAVSANLATWRLRAH
jgi:hypothetical protein